MTLRKILEELIDNLQAIDITLNFSEDELKEANKVFNLAHQQILALIPKRREIEKMYHYICYGGGGCRLVDKWGKEPEIHCGNSGDGSNDDGGWINGTACRSGCKRILRGNMEITAWSKNHDEPFNEAISEMEQSMTGER